MAAKNVSLGNGNLLDLLAFTVDVGNGTIGSRNVSAVGKRWENEGVIGRRPVRLLGEVV